MGNQTAKAYVNKMKGHNFSALHFGITDLGVVSGMLQYHPPCKILTYLARTITERLEVLLSLGWQQLAAGTTSA